MLATTHHHQESKTARRHGPLLAERQAAVGVQQAVEVEVVQNVGRVQAGGEVEIEGRRADVVGEVEPEFLVGVEVQRGRGRGRDR